MCGSVWHLVPETRKTWGDCIHFISNINRRYSYTYIHNNYHYPTGPNPRTDLGLGHLDVHRLEDPQILQPVRRPVCMCADVVDIRGGWLGLGPTRRDRFVRAGPGACTEEYSRPASTAHPFPRTHTRTQRSRIQARPRTIAGSCGPLRRSWRCRPPAARPRTRLRPCARCLGGLRWMGGCWR